MEVLGGSQRQTARQGSPKAPWMHEAKSAKNSSEDKRKRKGRIQNYRYD